MTTATRRESGHDDRAAIAAGDARVPGFAKTATPTHRAASDFANRTDNRRFPWLAQGHPMATLQPALPTRNFPAGYLVAMAVVFLAIILLWGIHLTGVEHS